MICSRYFCTFSNHVRIAFPDKLPVDVRVKYYALHDNPSSSAELPAGSPSPAASQAPVPVSFLIFIFIFFHARVISFPESRESGRNPQGFHFSLRFGFSFSFIFFFHDSTQKYVITTTIPAAPLPPVPPANPASPIFVPPPPPPFWNGGFMSISF